MPAVPVLVGVSIALQGASMVMQNQASKRAQGMANATAQHNALIDIEQAQQVDLDTTENIRSMRREDQVYLSRQRTAYAAAGVLSSGSPLAVEATTAGRMEQRVQQEYVNSQQKQQQLYSSAKVGVLYGQAQSEAYREDNLAAQLKGGAGILATGLSAYDGGAFGGKKT